MTRGIFLDAYDAWKIWRQMPCSSGVRPEAINHECQPLTLSVWSLGRALVWWSLFGNELLEAASIIHTYKSTVCPLFLEMRHNKEGGGAPGVSPRGMSFSVISYPSTLQALAICFTGTCAIRPTGGDKCCSLVHRGGLVHPRRGKAVIWSADLFIKVVFWSWKINWQS